MLDYLDIERTRKLFPDLLPDGPFDTDDVFEVLIAALDSEGELAFSLEWDSGGPGAGAGLETIYCMRSVFFTSSVDLGIKGPFESVEIALRSTVPMTDEGEIVVSASTREIRWPGAQLADLVRKLNVDQARSEARIWLNGNAHSIADLKRQQEAPTEYARDEAEGFALRRLSGTDAKARRETAFRLLQRSRQECTEEDTYASLRPILLMEWLALRTESAEITEGLVRAFHVEESMVAMEVIAMALALAGEDGLTELVSLVASEDFVIRHKAAVGIGVLDRSARWAVPALLRALRSESQPLMVYNLVNALGRIGGSESVSVLESIYADQRAKSPSDDDLLKHLEHALSHARLP